MDFNSIKVTGDGSHTLQHPELNESYHSMNGALTESKHVFIESGLDFISPRVDTVKILEIGFGTGLNALLSLQWSIEHSKRIGYHAMEPYPLSAELVAALNYCSDFGLESLADLLMRMHSGAGKLVDLTPLFEIEVIIKKFEAVSYPANYYNLIYFDAFSPAMQPELWEPAVFEKLFYVLEPEGVLVTYSAKGAVRRAMQSAGFVTERLPGPPGKREMLRALKYIQK